MSTLFIADLHLSAERPDSSALFMRLLHGRAVEADALYILGDLFEAWLGDDLILPEYQPIIAALHELTDSGVPVYVLHGNRDFLLGASFEKLTGCQLLKEGAVIDLHGHPTLLMHGDSLCTDDHDYQQLRQTLRNPTWQEKFLAQPARERIAYARMLRESSKQATADKQESIMDVNPQALAMALRQHGVVRLIHGHTHRPAVHQVQLDDRTIERIVLGDWYATGSVLECDEQGCRLQPFP